MNFKLFINIIYNNENIQNQITEKCNLSPIGSFICVNFIPNGLAEQVTLDISN